MRYRSESDITMELYRGFTIYYSIEENIFHSTLQEKYDLKNEPKRQSLKDTRKVIDEYIKKNANFEPFEALLGGSAWGDKERILGDKPNRIIVTGIKKDGGLMCKHLDKSHRGINETFQLNNTHYNDDRKRLFEVHPDLDLILATVAYKEVQIDDLRQEIKEELAKVKPLSLSFIEDFTGLQIPDEEE